MCTPYQQPREKKYPSKSRWSKLLKLSFFLAPGSPSFQACANCAYCQRPPEKLLLLHLFILFFYVIVFFKNFFLIPINYCLLQRNKRFSVEILLLKLEPELKLILKYNRCTCNLSVFLQLHWRIILYTHDFQSPLTWNFRVRKPCLIKQVFIP